jgi:dolichyl-phosphate-mannose-protein mannosyltransferase
VTRRLVIIAIVVIVALSAGARFYRLGTPKTYIFDEVYYAKDAKTILKGRVGPTQKAFPWEPGSEVSWPHPEWGKFLIAGGILLFGDNALGWRIASAIAGLVMLAAVYPLARRLGLAPVWALLALVLAAADTLGIAQSRIATLDIFVGLWTVLCLLFALRYAQDGRQMRWLVLSGVAGGLALGTKWSGAYALLAALLLLFLLRSRRTGELEEGVWPRVRRAGRAAPAPLALLVALPVGLYVASYWQYFAAGHTWAQWHELQRQMWQFNLHLHATHSYASLAPTWIADYRPVWYYFVSKNEVVHGVISIGNAFLWWSALACLLVLPFVALRRRRRGLAIAPLLVAVLYFPWFLTTRTSFMYYMQPVAPLLAILVATAIAAANGAEVRLPDHPPWEPAEPGAESASDEALREPEETPAYGAHGGEPEPRPSRRAPVWERRWALVPFAAGLAVMTLFWYPIGQRAEAVFWSLPQTVSPALAWGVCVSAAVLAAAAVIGIFLLPPLRDLRRQLLWAWSGAVVGWCLVFLPIVLSLPISSTHFYRLMWFGSWI